MKTVIRRTQSVLLVLSLAAGISFTQPMQGFGPSRVENERKIEQEFDSLLVREDLPTWMKRLSARPHHVGSSYDRENAEFIAGQFRSWGYESSIEEFFVLFPTPKERVLELTAPEYFAAGLAEPPLAEDATSSLTSEELPLYNCYSIDGDVTAPLVYVNYGVPRDYEELDRRGIDVRGKIVIARYGGSWRGIKPKVAGEHGAVGCIIYSDPREDGYFAGDVYPTGAYRSQYGGQRGSVMDISLYCGDPLTPSLGATKDAKRLDRKDAKTLTRIPVLPISYADALPLLRALGGPVAPEQWRGALPITYHCGPGPAVVHLKVSFSWDIVPIYDVISRLRGAEMPEEWVIRGNHHDAWVCGAEDPLSGQVAMMEEARAIGSLAAKGWKPKRTIVYCAWDGEEPGLLGSTEWVETHADQLAKSAVVYVNSDGNGRGFFGAGGSHTLEKFVNQVAREVIDPEKHVPVAERVKAVQILSASPPDRKELRDRADIHLSALGSGSDYTPFLQHLGIASLNIGYGGENGGGSYHSAYDSFEHYRRFGDPGFAYGITQAQTTGRLVLRLAEADVLPLDFDALSESVAGYVQELTKLVDGMRDDTDELNRKIKENTYNIASDPSEVWVTPKPKDPVPYLNFAPLQNALAMLRKSTSSFDDVWHKTVSSSLSAAQRRALDRVFMGFERSLTARDGLPGRPWYIHTIYAPGQYTGYGVKTIPGVREAIEMRKWQEASEQIVLVSHVLENAAAEIDKAIALVKSDAEH